IPLKVIPSHVQTLVLLALQLAIQQIQRLLIRLQSSYNRKHALACLIMRSLCNRDARTRQSTDLRDLGATLSNDATNHVCGNRNLLRAKVGVVGLTKSLGTRTREIRPIARS